MAIELDKTNGVGGKKLPSIDMGKVFVLKETLDCAPDNIGAGGIALLLYVPAGTYVEKVLGNVLTAEGGVLTFDVGTFDMDKAAIVANGFIDGANGNVVANNVLPAGTEAYANGYYFAAAGYIGLTCVDAADAAKIKLTAICYKVD